MTKNVINSEFSSTENITVTDSEFGSTENTTEFKFGSTGNITELEFEATEIFTNSEFSSTEKITDSEFSSTENITDSEFGSTNNTTHSKFGSTEGTTESKFGPTNSTTDSELVSSTENMTNSEFSWTENITESEFEFSTVFSTEKNFEDKIVLPDIILKPDPNTGEISDDCPCAGHFGISTDCQEYLWCQQGNEKGVRLKCAHNKFFDPPSTPCTLKEENNLCGYDSSVCVSRPVEYKCQDSGLFDDYNDCHSYWECEKNGGIGVHKTCKGLNFVVVSFLTYFEKKFELSYRRLVFNASFFPALIKMLFGRVNWNMKTERDLV